MRSPDSSLGALSAVVVLLNACSPDRVARARARPVAPSVAQSTVKSIGMGSSRWLDDPERIVVRSDTDPAALAAEPTAGLEPLLAEDFEERIPDAAAALGRAKPRRCAEASARGSGGVRFEPATGALGFAIPARPESLYLAQVHGRVTGATTADGEDAVGHLLVLELGTEPAPAELAPLLARIAGGHELLHAVHGAALARETFDRTRLAFKTSGRTHALLVVLLGGSFASVRGDAVGDPTGSVDFDELELFALPVARYFALQSPERVLPVDLDGDRRRALLALPPTQVEIPVDLPKGRVRVSFAYAALDDARPGERPDARHATLRFRADLVGAGGTRVLLRDELVPAGPESSRGWRDCAREFESAGGAARLLLATDASAASGAVAFFAEPKLERIDAGASSRPDVILISIDTLRPDRLGCYGYARPDGEPTSPRIDAFARKCLRFAAARSLAPWTLPSHATMFTGLSPPVHQVGNRGRRLIAGRHPSLSLEFAQAGYATAAFTAGGFVSPEYGFGAGFDRYTTVDPCIVDLLAGDGGSRRAREPGFQASLRSRFGLEAAFRWLEARRGTPCFLFLHTFVVHNYAAPRELERRFAPGAERALPPGARVAREVDALQREQRAPAELVRAMRDLYDATVATADQEIGALLEWLERSGRLDRTVVAIVSDHGEEHGEHDGFGHQHSLYEELLRVPLLLHVPGAVPGVVDEPVDLADLAPTLRDAAGLAPVEPCDGESLLARVRDHHFDEAFFAELSTDGLEQALRVGRLKLVMRPPGLPENASRRGIRPNAWELFDLAADPDEQSNLLPPTTDAGSLAARDDLPTTWLTLARRFDHERGSWLDRGQLVIGDPEQLEAAPSSELRRRLQELGYVAAAPSLAPAR